ncbi:MAG: hypothetical protein CFE24_09390 [Flavobacterium sp. BFFFF2]|nr:MAG: hypothetical protein CFE24_09390 [Flavobacterium sp. BFFFF2]
MKKTKILQAIVLTFICFLICNNGFSCSTYKVTVGNKTMYGINYDTWFTRPKIWFETKGYGAVFTGANYQGGHDLTPQSGMNVFGLSFGTLATPTPAHGKEFINKKQITSRSEYLKGILHACRTVEEVKAYIEQYDHSTLCNDVFLYTDKSGHYLVVEPYTLTLGYEPKYVLANFCPSTITDYSSVKQERYINGAAFLKNKIGTSLAFCTALSDTMHVCRPRMGDGTLLTSIMDLQKGIVHLYFYHNYKNQIQFNLKQELAKGDHSFEIDTLFAKNAEYQQLLHYKTPLNSNLINYILWGCFGLFSFACPYFLISYFRNKKIKFATYKLLLSALSLCMAYYMVVLELEMGIYFFPAPYKRYKFGLIDVVSYLPFLVLLLFIPLLMINRKVLIDNTWNVCSKILCTVNNFTLLILIMLFWYWGLYDVFN